MPGGTGGTDTWRASLGLQPSPKSIFYKYCMYMLISSVIAIYSYIQSWALNQA